MDPKGDQGADFHARGGEDNTKNKDATKNEQEFGK